MLQGSAATRSKRMLQSYKLMLVANIMPRCSPASRSAATTWLGRNETLKQGRNRPKVAAYQSTLSPRRIVVTITTKKHTTEVSALTLDRSRGIYCGCTVRTRSSLPGSAHFCVYPQIWLPPGTGPSWLVALFFFYSSAIIYVRIV